MLSTTQTGITHAGTDDAGLLGSETVALVTFWDAPAGLVRR